MVGMARGAVPGAARNHTMKFLRRYCRETELRFSLSPRERAGVRGKRYY